MDLPDVLGRIWTDLVAGPSAGFGELALAEATLRQLDATGWELYHVDEEPAEEERAMAKAAMARQ